MHADSAIPEPLLPAPPDALTTTWWEATREGRLLLQRCQRCGSFQFHPRLVCRACGAGQEDLSWTEAAGTGTVDAWTAVHRAPVPDLAVPYLVARVRLAEGPVLLTNLIDVLPADPEPGQRVRLAWRALPDGRQLPVFTTRTNGAGDAGQDADGG